MGRGPHWCPAGLLQAQPRASAEGVTGLSRLFPTPPSSAGEVGPQRSWAFVFSRALSHPQRGLQWEMKHCEAVRLPFVQDLWDQNNSPEVASARTMTLTIAVFWVNVLSHFQCDGKDWLAPDFFFFLNILAIKNTKQGKLHLGEKTSNYSNGIRICICSFVLSFKNIHNSWSACGVKALHWVYKVLKNLPCIQKIQHPRENSKRDHC